MKAVKQDSDVGYPTNQRVLGQFFLTGSSKSDMWQFFNPQIRNWEFLKVFRIPIDSYSHSIIVRNGWVVRKVQKARPPYYFSVENFKLKSIKPDFASSLAYLYAHGITELTAIKKGKELSIDLREVHLPSNQYHELITLGRFDNPLDNYNLIIPESQLEKVRSLLIPVGIRLIVSENLRMKPEKMQNDLQIKISDILTLLYSKYLKKESEIENLLIALLTKNIDSIPYTELREKLRSIYYGDPDNTENQVIRNFLSEKVVEFFDWKYLESIGIDPRISGLIIRTKTKEYSGKWTNNYLKIIIPDFKSVVHLQTTISPSKRGTGRIHPLSLRLSKISLDKWRLYPYLGKIKNTGTREVVKFENSSRDYIESCFTTILGIPSIELLLRELCYLDSFKLDLEEWRGAYNLSRYFLTYVKVLEPLDHASRVPCMLVEDFFGNTFRIAWDFDTYLHYSHDIHHIQKGGYISILVENKLNNAENAYNKVDFETVFAISYRFARRDEFVFKNILALIKYLSYVEQEDLRQLIGDISPETSLEGILKNLEEKNLVVLRGKLIYYLYYSLNKDQMSSILSSLDIPETGFNREFLNQKWYMQWALMRESVSAIHPFIYSESVYSADNFSRFQSDKYKKILDFCNKIKQMHVERASTRAKLRTNYLLNLRREGVKFQETLIGKKSEDVYLKHTSFMFLHFGQATIKARGKWIPKAHDIVKSLTRRFSYMEPSINRTDRMIKDPMGKYVREVEFYVEAFKLR